MIQRSIVAVLIAVFTVTIASAQEDSETTLPGEVSRFGQRYDAFLLLFADRGIQKSTLAELAPHGESGAGWTLVILGVAPSVSELPIDLTRFVQSGGSLLVATDGPAVIPFDGGPHLRIYPGPVEAINSADGYREITACPLITNLKRESPLFTGVNQLALNLPGFLAGGDSASWTLARFPKAVNIGVFAPAVIAGGSMGKGRFIVAADQSLFTNEMIEESDNARFADNVVSWVTANQTADQSPTKVVVLVDRKEVPSLIDDRFVSGQWKANAPTNELINELLHGLQEEDALNEIVREGEASLSSSGPWPVRQFVLIVSTSVIAALMVWRILSARQENLPRSVQPALDEEWVSSLSPEEAASLVRAHRLIELRERDFKQVGNYANPLEQLAVEFFDRRFGVKNWPDQLPRLLFHGSVWERLGARRDTARLWKLAKSGETGFISRQKYEFWKDRISRLDSMMEMPSQGDGTSDKNLLAGNS